MHAFNNGGSCPNDDARLARIACCTPEQWAALKPVLQPFFYDGWRHKRVEDELARHNHRVANGKLGGRPKKANRKLNLSPKPSQYKDAADAAILEFPASGAENAERELFTRGKQVLGPSAGGMVANLLKVKQGSVAAARAAIELASTK